MTGTSIFRKETGPVQYFEQIEIGGYSFSAGITVQEKRGDPSAIHCGRITYFEMLSDDELVAYFDDGQWYIVPNRNTMEGDFEEAASLAVDILIGKYSSPEKMRYSEDRLAKYDLKDQKGTIYYRN